MIHLAVPCANTRRGTPFTAMGLGDRIVPLRIAYRVSVEARDAVTLHLTGTMHAGGYKYQPGTRAELWREALATLFPAGHVQLQLHECVFAKQAAWLRHLKRQGIDAETWYLGDTFGLRPYEERVGFDASPHLRSGMELPPPPCSAQGMPQEPFVTMQPSGHKLANKCSDEQKRLLIERWRGMGYSVVVVGHEAGDSVLANSLSSMAATVARSEIHIGADSGTMHVAGLFKPYDKLRLITPGRPSRNREHWLANGVQEEWKP